MRALARRYAAFARRQAGTVNCGEGAAIAGAVAVVVIIWAAVAFVIRYHVVIEQAGAAVAGTVLTAAIAWAVLALRRRASCRVPAAHPARAVPAGRPAPARVPPCVRGCGRPAAGEVTWSNGVRSGTELLCAPCWTATETADALVIAAQEAHREAAAMARPPAPSVADVAREHGLVPAAPDNAPAADRDIALDLAAVLRTAREYRRGHP